MPPKKDTRQRATKRINWVFRASYAGITTEEDEVESEATQLYGQLVDHCTSFAFQLESAPTTGYLHFQGFMQFVNRKRFDWIQTHIQKFEYLDGMKGKASQAWAYATKLETRTAGPWTFGDFDEITTKKDTTYEDALKAPTVREAIEIVKQNRPRDYCLYGSTIERNINNAHKKPFTHKYNMKDFNREPLVFTKSSLVYGPSNTGKTSFVLAHFKNPLFVSHADGLKKLTPDHDAIVFDDLSFTHWPPESVIQLVDQDQDRDVHIRYGTATIPAGTTKVFTHNKKEIFYKPDVSEDQKTAIDRRVDYFHVQNKLFGQIAQAIPVEYAEFTDDEEVDEGEMNEVD